MKIKNIAIFLILLCCLMGAASAAEDVSTDVVDACDDDLVVVDGVSEDSKQVVEEENSVDDVAVISDDINYLLINEENSEDIASDEIIDNKDSKLGSSDSDSSILGGIGWGPEGSQGTFDHYNSTYANKTFNGFTEMCNDCIFLDCNFTNATLDMQEFYYHEWLGAPENMWGVEESYVCNFTNCNFVNSTLDEGSLILSKRYSLVNFINCTFENITADSIVSNVGGFTLQDAINFYECSFNNVSVKGIVDVPVRTNPYERYRIEDCTYDGILSDNYAVLSEDNRDYINATKPRLESVLSMGFDEEGNLIVNVTDIDGNPLANYDVFISLNGDELTPYVLDDEGNLTLDLIEMVGAGEINVTALFEDNDDYKGSSASISTFLVVKTVIQNVTVEVPVAINPVQTAISASDLSATANTAKSLIVALKDANGNALSNKAIKVLVNGKESNIVTDSNGVAKINVNYANAGTYHYVLSFLGDNDYKACLKSVKVTVAKQAVKATFAKKTFKVKSKSKKISFTLKDGKGKAIKGKKITFTVNKKTYSAKTNAKGVATVKVKLTKKGKFTAVAKFAGDNAYKAISKKAKITIK